MLETLLEVFSMFILIIGPYNLQTPFLFHGNLCGNQKCLHRLVSLFGQSCGIGENINH